MLCIIFILTSLNLISVYNLLFKRKEVVKEMLRFC